jgi:DNA-binding Xre family transcriptional regulator
MDKRTSGAALTPFRGNDVLDQYLANLPADQDMEERLRAASDAINVVLHLHRLRQQRGVTQAVVAEHSGLQQQAVSRLERGFSPSMKLETLRRYLNALDCDMEILVADKVSRGIIGRLLLPGA